MQGVFLLICFCLLEELNALEKRERRSVVNCLCRAKGSKKGQADKTLAKPWKPEVFMAKPRYRPHKGIHLDQRVNGPKGSPGWEISICTLFIDQANKRNIFTA